MFMQSKLTFSELKGESKNKNQRSLGIIAIETKEKANVKHLLQITLKEKKSLSILSISVPKKHHK